LFYLNSVTSPNLHLINWLPDYGLDAGGKCAEWLSLFPKNKILEINHLSSCSWDENDLPENINKIILNFLNNDTRNTNKKYFAEVYNKNIIHYRAGSNLMGDLHKTHHMMVNLLDKTLNELYEI
jgi:hypothetical protein